MANPFQSALSGAACRARSTSDVLTSQTELPARRAFTVQLDGTSAIADGHFAGRVEHVLTGQRRRFGSLAELTAFIVQAVRQSESSQ